MNKPLRVLALCVVIFCYVPALSAASPSIPPDPFYFTQDPINFGPSEFSSQSMGYIVHPPIPSTPDSITGEQEAVPLHDDSMNFAFDSEVRHPPDNEEYTYKENDMAGLPKFWIGYGFVPLPPGPSVHVPVEGLNSAIPITMWNGTTDWSGTFLTFMFGPGTEQTITDEPDDGVDADQKEAPACEVCWGHMEYRP